MMKRRRASALWCKKRRSRKVGITRRGTTPSLIYTIADLLRTPDRQSASSQILNQLKEQSTTSGSAKLPVPQTMRKKRMPSRNKRKSIEIFLKWKRFIPTIWVLHLKSKWWRAGQETSLTQMKRRRKSKRKTKTIMKKIRRMRTKNKRMREARMVLNKSSLTLWMKQWTMWAIMHRSTRMMINKQTKKIIMIDRALRKIKMRRFQRVNNHLCSIQDCSQLIVTPCSFRYPMTKRLINLLPSTVTRLSLVNPNSHPIISPVILTPRSSSGETTNILTIIKSWMTMERIVLNNSNKKGWRGTQETRKTSSKVPLKTVSL